MAVIDHGHSPTPEEIMEYLDGEGTAASRMAIEGHLTNCGTCQAVAASQRQLSDNVNAWRVDAVPASLLAPATHRARVFPRAFSLRSSRSRLAFAGVAVAAAVVVAVSVAVSLNRRDSGAAAVRPPAAAKVMSVSQGQQSERRFDAGSRSFEPLTRLDGPGPGAGGAGGLVGGVSGGVVGGVVGGLDALSQSAQSITRAQTLTRPDGGRGQPRQPAIVRTATLRIVSRDFGGVRSAVEAIVTEADGFIDQMTVTGDGESSRALRGTLRIPANRLADVAERLRRLGQVVEDTQSAADVTDQLIDLDARLASGRATERRLTELLRDRTGKLSDVLEVERELTRVRLDIERLAAESTNIGRRVSYASLSLDIVEERKAGSDSGALSFGSQIRIATADGLAAAVDSVVWTMLLLLRAAPSLLLWGVVLGAVGVILWRALRSRWRDSPL